LTFLMSQEFEAVNHDNSHVAAGQARAFLLGTVKWHVAPSQKRSEQLLKSGPNRAGDTLGPGGLLTPSRTIPLCPPPRRRE
jgi:hypothetical protein